MSFFRSMDLDSGCPINSNTFPGKLWKLVDSERFQSIRWSNGGNCIAINGTTFKNEILYNGDFNVFKTQNFSSFVRQLNLYGFRKLAAVSSKDSLSGEDIHHFQNPYFNRNRPEMLEHVRRANSRRRSSGCENAENYGSTPYCFRRFTTGSSGGNRQTLFHRQGVPCTSLAPDSHCGPLRDTNNRFNPYHRPTSCGYSGQQCYGRTWRGGSGLQGLTLIANTASGSLTATCPSEPRLVDFPSLYNQNGQLRKFVVIQEDLSLGQNLHNYNQGGRVPLSRCENPLLSSSSDPMMCEVSQLSPPHHQTAAGHQPFIFPPTPNPHSWRGASGFSGLAQGCTPAAPQYLREQHARMPSSPVVFTELSPLPPQNAVHAVY